MEFASDEATAATTAFQDYMGAIEIAAEDAADLEKYTACEAAPSGDKEADGLCNDRYWRIQSRLTRSESRMGKTRRVAETAVKKLRDARDAWHKNMDNDMGDEKEDILALFLIRTNLWIDDRTVDSQIATARRNRKC